MSFEKPKYKTLKQLEEKKIPKGLWIKCLQCHKQHLSNQIKSNIYVCDKCGYHFRMPAKDRLNLLLDEGSFVEYYQDIRTSDPLEFEDAKGKYTHKIKNAIEKLKINEGVLVGTGRIFNFEVAIGVMEFAFLGGSMGSVVGEKIYRLMLLSIEKKIPLIMVSSSGGARMHEGILSLMQMAKTCAGLKQMEKEKIFFISILTDPTMGGVTASFASLGDVIIAEPGAIIGFAGARVIEQTIKQKLPDKFQTAEFLLEHGFIDLIIERKKLKDMLSQLLRFFSP